MSKIYGDGLRVSGEKRRSLRGSLEYLMVAFAIFLLIGRGLDDG
jgi:hypothetical protein